jgi:hypothetical protein
MFGKWPIRKIVSAIAGAECNNVRATTTASAEARVQN